MDKKEPCLFDNILFNVVDEKLVGITSGDKTFISEFILDNSKNASLNITMLIAMAKKHKLNYSISEVDLITNEVTEHYNPKVD